MMKAVSVALVITLLLCTFVACNSAETKADFEKEYDVEVTKAPTTTEAPYELAEGVNPLTGLENLSESAKGKRPVAIMVADSSQTTPLGGIMTPDLTIVSLVEENKVGTMWVYADSTKIPNEIGPIAPAHEGFAGLAQDMNAIYVHYDGETVEGVDNIDGAKYNGKYFFPDETKYQESEYQAVTSQAYIESAISIIGYSMSCETKDYAPYHVGVKGETIPQAGEGGVATSVKATFSKDIVYSFEYNEKESVYYQYVNGQPVVGANGEKAAYTNVIYLYVNIKYDNNGKAVWDFGKADMLNDAAYISEGYGQNICWCYDSETDRLVLMNQNGSKILKINPGNVWIGIRPDIYNG